MDPLEGARLTCVECSMNESMAESADFCSRCARKGVDHLASLSQKHTPGHHLVQLRVVMHRRSLLALLQRAADVVTRPFFQGPDRQLDQTTGAETGVAQATHGRLETSPRPQCAICKTIVTCPYWYCLQCYDETYLCFECNDKIEIRQPWLFEHKPRSDPEGLHDWAHPLVLIPPPYSRPDQVELSMPDRLASLESKLNEHLSENSKLQDELAARLLGLETLLRKMLQLNGDTQHAV